MSPLARRTDIAERQRQVRKATGSMGRWHERGALDVMLSTWCQSSAQQQMADQINELQRQLLNQQGERKLLSEQVGALSARVDNLMDSTAATPISTGQPAQKRRAPR
jgi:hypothetical protein